MTTRLPIIHRACGSCDACCRTVQVKSLDKGDYEPCKHLRRGPIRGCSIYKARPEDCSGYACIWLAGGLENSDMRPDRCGVVLSGGTSEEIGHYIMVHELWPDAAKAPMVDTTLKKISARMVVFVIMRDGLRRLRGGPPEIVNRILKIIEKKSAEDPTYRIEEKL